MQQYLIVGDGRMAKHLRHYFDLLAISYCSWKRTDGISSLTQLVAQSDFVLVLISDDAIEDFVLKHKKGRARWIHFSGRLNSIHAHGMHPLMTFSAQLYDLESYQAVPFITDPELSFTDVFPHLANPHYAMEKHLRPLYHALCVLSGNFSVVLWNKAFKEFQDTLNLPQEVLHPYMNRVFQNLLINPEEALTGPLVRNDQKTIQEHLDSLSGDAAKTLYQAFLQTHGKL